MKGKKVDAEFLSNFITECISKQKISSEDIVTEAKTQIQIIDDKIKEVEQLKIIRSKLLDVVSTFDKGKSLEKTDEIKALSFFKIQHPHICKMICDRIKQKVLDINELNSLEKSPSDVLFCVKQLLEHKVIARSGNYLLRGDNFEDYLKHVFIEVKL